MSQKKINRRKFLVTSLECAAGLGVLMSCDKRTPVEPDVRKPSSPVGLTNDYGVDNNGAITNVVLNWNPNGLTDVSGASLTTVNPDIQISGYNLYRTYNSSTPPDLSSAQPINGSSLITGTSFTDADSFGVGDSYYYWLEAVDSDNIASPLSAPLQVPIMAAKPVYIAQNTNAVLSNGALVQEEVTKTVNAAVIAVAQGITQTTPSSVGDAYKSIFGGVTAQSMIGIKINTLASLDPPSSNLLSNGLSSHREVVAAIVQGLTTMVVDGGTFPANNIIVFDDRYWGPDSNNPIQMLHAGYPLQNDGVSYRIASVNYNTTLNGIPVNEAESSSLLWAPGTNLISNTPTRLSSIVPKLNYIINVPVIKDHVDAGITFALKNFFGAIDHQTPFHNGSCNDAVPQVYQLVLNQLASTPNRTTPILTIGDGFLGAYQGGPSTAPTNWFPAQVIAGIDPVAIDAHVLKMINVIRAMQKNLPPYSYAYKNLGSACHILTAALKYNLGSIAPKPISVQV
jgi:Domain of unknown function (DUF362)